MSAQFYIPQWIYSEQKKSFEKEQEDEPKRGKN